MTYHPDDNPSSPASAWMRAPADGSARLAVPPPERVLVLAGGGALSRRRAQSLVEAGIAVRVAATPDAAADALASFNPQAVLVWPGALPDTTLPASLLYMRQEAHQAGIPLLLALTGDDLARPGLPDLIGAADDFLLSPPDLRELAVRLAAWSHRQRPSAPEGVLMAGRVTLDLIGHRVAVNGRDVPLTHKEFEMVRFLVTHSGRVMSREMILGEVWGHDFYGGLRTVDVHIRRIRSKLEADGLRCIETVRNVGYKFVME